MSLSGEICKLHELHTKGALDDRQLARAKHCLLRGAAQTAEASAAAARGEGTSRPVAKPTKAPRRTKRLWMGATVVTVAAAAAAALPLV